MSTIQVSPYINFQGRTREALEFYHQLLGGTLDLYTMTQQGGYQPAGPGDRIMQARLAADGALIIAADGYPAQAGENIALALTGTDKERVTQIFNGLGEGGKIKMPLTAQPDGTAIGWLMDQFGINWMVSLDQA